MRSLSRPGSSRTRALAGLTAAALAVSLSTPAGASASSTAKQSARSSASKSVSAGSLTTSDAVAQARRTGKAVSLPSATTALSTLTANPDGTLSLSENTVPVRKKVGDTWRNLDATLVRNADGSISPRLSDEALTLSGGGAGPLAALSSTGEHLSLTLPTALPSPILSGPTATYHNVAPGVDLVVTANTLGGFSDTFVVHDAAAATSPALAALLDNTVATTGLAVTTDHGAIEAKDRSGRTVFNADAPTVWDSATDAASATSAPAVQAISTAAAPGVHAHRGALTPRVSGSTLTLSPDASVLHGAATAYPVYIDPTWNPVMSTSYGWATVAEEYPTQGYWNTTAESEGLMAVGDGVSYASLIARTLINFPLPTSTLSGSVIESAVFSATNYYSGACADGGTDEEVDVHAPSTALTNSNPKWEYWDTSSEIGSTIGFKSFAHGYSTSCATDGTSGSDSIGLSTTTFTDDVSAGKQTQTLVLVAADESSENSWKEFVPSTAKLTITYGFYPTVTQPSTNSEGCATTVSDASVVGKGDVKLLANVYQKGGSSLTADFRLYNSSETVEYNPTSTTAATTTSPSGVAATSGSPAELPILASFFNAFSSTSTTTFAWTLQVMDAYPLKSGIVTCYFTYDPTSPGQPDLYDAGGTVDCNQSTLAYQIGKSATFVVDANGTGSEPGTYYYQLNGAAPIAVPANGGDATFSLLPTSGTNVLTVDAANAAGNIGDPARCYFNASAAAAAADHDMNGDGHPDLLTTGTGSGNMPSGLWLADGSVTGQVAAAPTDLGINGAGLVGTPTDYSGAQAIVGQFTGDNLNDVLTYYPAGTTLNGTTGALTQAQGQIINGTGDGSALQSEDSEYVNTVYGAALSDVNGLTPNQIANAYHADVTNTNTAYPDLIGTAGSSTAGYYLDYYPSNTTVGGYLDGNLDNAMKIAMNTPDTNPDWNNWTIATAQVGTSVDMFLWDKTSGALYLWTGISVTDHGDGTGTLTHAAGYPLYDASTGHTFDQSVSLHALEAADINGDGTPDLYTVDTSGHATTYLVSSLSTTANASTISTVTSNGGQPLSMATHDWPLNDYAGTDADNATTGTLPLTGNSGVYQHTGDLFSPDVDFTGAGQLATTSTTATALNLSSSFTISLWTKPLKYGEIPVSQDGTSYPTMMLYPTPSGWDFYLSKDNGTTVWGGDAIVGGSVQLGTWAHLQATWNSSTKVMSLYVDDTIVASADHATPSATVVKPFRLGSNINNGNQSSFYNGQIADVQTYSGQALAPNQPNTPASYHQAVKPERLLDTRGSTGDTLTGGTTTASTPVAAYSTTELQIAGDPVTPIVSGGDTTIPATVTAVSIDITAVSETSTGNLIDYADGTQQPLTSNTNYAASTTVTGYNIVPVGLDGKIAIYNYSTGTTHLIVDLTGYFTSDASQTGNQTYHPLGTAFRALNTASDISRTNGTLTSTGVVAANKSFTLQITGVDGIPSTATAVAVNLTAYNNTGLGILEAYQTGASPVPTDTSLTYDDGQIASLNADVSIGTGGTITIANSNSTTDIIADIAGYYSNDTSGDVFHTVNPTRLVDTRTGLGGFSSALPANGNLLTTAALTQEITNTPNPVLALQLTEANAADNGDFVAYPAPSTSPPTAPSVSNVNWVGGQATANLALVPTGYNNSIVVTNQDPGTAQLIIDCSGYFAAS